LDFVKIKIIIIIIIIIIIVIKIIIKSNRCVELMSGIITIESALALKVTMLEFTSSESCIQDYT